MRIFWRSFWRSKFALRWRIFRENPYQHLLLSLIFLFFAFAFVDNDYPFGGVAINALFLLTVLFVIETFQLPQRFLNFFRLIAILSFCINSYIVLFLEQDIWFSTFISHIIQLIFIATAIWIILKRIFRDKHVTGDILVGGISVYLMVGFLWFQLYQILVSVDPKAFSQTMTYYRTFYFSFVTLTTVGYGDIVPINRVGMVMSNMEAIIGQMYPAVILSRLVSLYVQDLKD
jgi:hypothetical protein